MDSQRFTELALQGTLAVCLIALVVLGGLNLTGHALPGQTEHTLVDDPTTDQPDVGTIDNYETDLTDSERTRFRQADGAGGFDRGAPGTISADYVELDGEYYALDTDTAYTHPVLHITLLIGELAAIVVAAAFAATGICIALISAIAIPLSLLRYAYFHAHRIATDYISQTTIAIGLSLLLVSSVLVGATFIPLETENVHVSTSPVDDPDLDNADVVHLTDLDDEDNQNVREAITSSAPTPHDALTYEAAAYGPDTDPLGEANYLQTDGEYYHVTTEQGIDPADKVLILYAAIMAGVIGCLLPKLAAEHFENSDNIDLFNWIDD